MGTFLHLGKGPNFRMLKRSWRVSFYSKDWPCIWRIFRTNYFDKANRFWELDVVTKMEFLKTILVIDAAGNGDNTKPSSGIKPDSPWQFNQGFLPHGNTLSWTSTISWPLQWWLWQNWQHLIFRSKHFSSIYIPVKNHSPELCLAAKR